MKTKQIIDEASKIVSDDREKAYGNKKANHNNIAKLWSAYLDKDISPHDVAMLMTLLKIARTIPGKPAPVPKSTSLLFFLKSINLNNWAESKICLDHINFSVLFDMRL